MPSLYNGCGTWYYGKENVHLEWGTCEHCRRVTTLISYDTQRYLVAIEVPLIPFGRFRVLRDCPACTKHKAIKLAQWESLKAEAREKALATVQNPPDSREELEAAVGGVIAFHDVDTWNEIVPILVERYPNDPDMVSLIGSGYHFFNHLEEASNALRVSLEGKDDAGTRRELGLVLIRLRRAEEAHEVLRPLLTAGLPENLQYWFLLAGAYQAAGDHRSALDLINEANRHYPETASYKEWKALKKTSEKNLASGKAVVPKILKTDTQRIKETSAPIARFAGPVVLLALALGFAVWSYNTSQHHKLFIVNGLDRPYEVQWDGQTHKLARLGVLPLETAEGEHTVAAPDIGLEPQTISVQANAIVRPFASPLFVVNPDQVAPVIRESLEYVEESDASGDSEYECELYVGLFHKVRKVNYPFQPFPQTVMGPEGSSTTRTRVGLARDWSQTDVYLTLTGEGQTERAREYMLGRFGHEPDNLDTLELLSSVLPEGEYLAMLRGKLAARPVHVEVHRTYQEILERHPEHDLIGEYAQYLAADPGNTSLKYLLARAHGELDEEALRLYREACEAEPPCPHAYHALALFHITEGRAAEALASANRACELLPGNAHFKGGQRTARIAAGAWEDLLAGIERNPNGTPVDYRDILLETLALSAMGKPLEEIEKQTGRTLAVWRRDGLERTDELQRVIKRFASYVQGDLDTYCQNSAGSSPGQDFGVAVTQGDLDGAVKAFAEIEIPSLSDIFTAYLLAETQGDSARAEEYLNMGVAALRQESRAQREIAACFSGETPCIPGEISVFGEPPEYMAVVLTALGTRFPEHREAFFARARVLNFNPQFPHRFLNELLGQAPEMPATAEPTGAATGGAAH